VGNRGGPIMGHRDRGVFRPQKEQSEDDENKKKRLRYEVEKGPDGLWHWRRVPIPNQKGKSTMQ
jgi:hypothetical protein